MIDDFVRVLCEKLNDEVRAEIQGLARGGAKDYAAYQYSCGVLRGMELAAEAAQDLLKAVHKADDQ